MVIFRKDATDSELKRQTKGLAIASLGSCIMRINKLRYKVKSQSDEWKCKSLEIGKDGRRFNKRGLIQKYLCQSCDYRFVINVGFEHSKKNPKVICAAIDLYFKGVSLRKTADHVKQFYGVRIDNTSVLRWIRRFAEVVSPFVDKLSPQRLSGIYHVDENSTLKKTPAEKAGIKLELGEKKIENLIRLAAKNGETR